MTVRAVLGLGLLNAHIFVVGASLLWGARGWRNWSELARLAGLAYFLGLSALIVAVTVQIVGGISFGTPALLAASAVLVACGLGLGRVRRHRAPDRPRLSLPSVTAASVIFGAGLATLLVWLFRAAQFQPLGDSDSWWVWTIRAKALHFFGDLGGADLVGGDGSGYASYPPGVSIVQAAAFEAMGSADTVTVHLQHWFLAAAFAAAVVGLLATRVRAAVLLPFVLLLLAMPAFVERATWTRADCLMGYFAGVGALLLYLWTEDRARWRLEAAVPILAGAMLTKREGAVLVACVLLATLVAAGSPRRSWRPLAAVLGLVLVLVAPWRISIAARGHGEGPTEGVAFLDEPERALSALGLVIQTIFEPMWLGLGAFLVVGALLALAVGATRLVAFVLALLGGGVAGWSVVIWAETAFSITQVPSQNPVIRMSLALLLAVGPFVPLLFAAAWDGSTERARTPTDGGRESRAVVEAQTPAEALP